MANLFRIALALASTTLGSAFATDPQQADVMPESLVDAILQRAQQGDAGAQLLLGSLYDTGQGVLEDDAEALRWYRLAAEQGLAEAQVNLGVMYDNGEGVSEDDAEAARWYRLAAEQGHPKAQLNVALQYILGEGVPVDHVRAYAWLDLGAARGDPDAGNVRDNLAAAMSTEQISQAQMLADELADRIPQR